jgi:Zn-dependent protease with chaperone function
MDYEKIRIKLEEALGRELYTLMQGDIVSDILKEAKIEKIENEWKFMLEGHSFKVNESLAPRLATLFKEVQEKLEFEEPIDFYVTNSSQVNAFSISRLEDEEAHIINFNSALVERLDDDELRFVIGHEIGHLISKNAHIMKLIQFIFPDPQRMPLILTHKITLWRKLSELTADRYGYIASPSIEKMASGFFKLSSGLDAKRINFDFKAYLAENEKILEYFRKESSTNLLSHPINPIRIKAIELFDQSQVLKQVKEKAEVATDENLDKDIEDLISILLTLSSSELDNFRKHFIAAAGIKMAGLDQQLNQPEYENIIRALSNFTIFPKAFLDSVSKQENIDEILAGAAGNIIKMNPGERYNLFDFMIGMALSDHNLFRQEIAFLYEMGTKFFGFQRKEIAQIISKHINQSFMPGIYS